MNGNSVLELLQTRSSVRGGFSERAVPSESLQKVVACGLAAPSSKNAQPWRLHVVTDSAVRDRLVEVIRSAEDQESYVPHDPRTGQPRTKYSSTVAESLDVVRSVPATIWIENIGGFSDGRATLLSVPRHGLSVALAGYAFEMIGIGAAMENMWIAANALGIAVAFLGDVLIAEDAVRDVLGFGGDLCGALALGYSDWSPPPPRDEPAKPELERIVWH